MTGVGDPGPGFDLLRLRHSCPPSYLAARATITPGRSGRARRSGPCPSSEAVSRFDLITATLASAAFTAGRSLMASNQRATLGWSSHFTPWASWLRVHGKVAMSAIGIVLAAEIRHLCEALLEQLIEPLQFRGVAGHRIVAAGLRREQLEMGPLAEHRSDAGELDHQPLDHLVFPGGVGGQKLSGLLGEIEQDRTRLDHRVWPAAGTVMIDDGRDLAVRIDAGESPA